MKKTKRSLNQHQPGCGPYTPGACCKLAKMIQEQDPLFFEAIVEASTSAPARTKHRKVSARSAPKAVKRPLKAPKGERGIRSDSSLDRLNIDPDVVRDLIKMKIPNVGALLAKTVTEIEKLDLPPNDIRSILRSVKKFGKKFAD